MVCIHTYAYIIYKYVIACVIMWLNVVSINLRGWTKTKVLRSGTVVENTPTRPSQTSNCEMLIHLGKLAEPFDDNGCSADLWRESLNVLSVRFVRTRDIHGCAWQMSTNGGHQEAFIFSRGSIQIFICHCFWESIPIHGYTLMLGGCVFSAAGSSPWSTLSSFTATWLNRTYFPKLPCISSICTEKVQYPKGVTYFSSPLLPLPCPSLLPGVASYFQVPPLLS